jgi:hypothetical protein
LSYCHYRNVLAARPKHFLISKHPYLRQLKPSVQTSAALQSEGSAFASNSATAIAGITGGAVFGNLFQSELLGYFSAYTGVGYVLGVKQAGYHNLAAGVGNFGYEPNVDSVFGIPRSVSACGAVMNIPVVNIVGSDSTTATAKTDFTFQLGALSRWRSMRCCWRHLLSQPFRLSLRCCSAWHSRT